MPVNREKTDYDYTMEELSDESLYTIKNRCFLCEIKITNDFEYFTQYGNCCRECSYRVSRVVTKYKFMPHKKEIAIKQLEERRHLVKTGILKHQDDII